jgi:polyisoprenoid-binding protein YceI
MFPAETIHDQEEPTMRKLAFALAAGLALASAPAFAATYDIDPVHSAASFSIKHLGLSTVRGDFGKLTGSVTMTPGDVKTAKVTASIDASTVNTREPKRDAHLKSADFFDVAKFPTLDFKSTSVSVGAGGTFKLTGALTMHGVTKTVTFDCEPVSKETQTPFGTTIIATSGTTKINRKDFGISGGKASMLVGDEVTVTVDLEMDKKK